MSAIETDERRAGRVEQAKSTIIQEDNSGVAEEQNLRPADEALYDFGCRAVWLTSTNIFSLSLSFYLSLSLSLSPSPLPVIPNSFH